MALALFWIKKEFHKSIKHSIAFMFRDATPYYLQAIISFSLAIFLYFEMLIANFFKSLQMNFDKKYNIYVSIALI